MTIRAYPFFAEGTKKKRKEQKKTEGTKNKTLYGLTYRIKLYRYYTVCVYVPHLYTNYITSHITTILVVVWDPVSHKSFTLNFRDAR